MLRSLGIQPSLLACRCGEPLDEGVRKKLVRAGRGWRADRGATVVAFGGGRGACTRQAIWPQCQVLVKRACGFSSGATCPHLRRVTLVVVRGGAADVCFEGGWRHFARMAHAS